MRSVAKVFIGDIIEGARRVQAEWAEKLDEKQTDLPTPEPSPSLSYSGADGMEGVEPTERDKQPEEPSHIKYGPLRPDHLREAMRRYKLSMEGGSVGMHALWHQQQHSGVERFGTRTRGRRLFK